MNLELATSFVGRKVNFTYKGEKRNVLVQQAKNCKNGRTVMVGIDLQAEADALRLYHEIGSESDFTRTFRLNGIQGLTVVQ